ncbi:MAG TPA: DinB family protein [Thermoanaerobaculia bacterium]|nr:DinB family protein [Thermoanaerobaculia bacterium]
MAYSFDGSMATLRAQLPELRAIAQLPEEHLFAVKQQVSGWCPAEHLDHTVKVAQSIVYRLADATAEPSPRGISFAGRAVLLLGWIPRGVGKAPERLRAVRCSVTDLEARIGRYETALAAVTVPAGTAARLPIVPHPRFGGLTPAEAMRFAAVHTRHHLRIVADVLKR